MTLIATTDGTYAAGAALPAVRPAATARGGHRVRVWDLPTRLFHWSLAACLVALAVTGYAGGATMYWHARFGHAVLALLLFRLVWGFLGGRWSRFASFLPWPRRVIAYLRGRGEGAAGHNPLGALSVFAMLAMLFVQVGTGLVSDDEISFTGPLNRFVGAAQGLAATWFHKQVGQWLLAALVGLHVVAIVFYLVRKGDNLVQPMIDGDKTLGAAVPASRDDARTRLAAALVFAACASAVAWISQLG